MKQLALLAILLFTLLAPSASADLIQNPGFELGAYVSGGGLIPDWMNPCLGEECSGSWGVGNVSTNSGSKAAADGCSGATAGCLNPDGGSVLSQNVTTDPGLTYNLTFWYDSSVQGSGDSSGSHYTELDVYWDGTLQAALVNTEPGYQQYTFNNLDAASVATALQFRARNDTDHAWIDDVQVTVAGTVTPEPVSMGLAAAGLAALALRARRIQLKSAPASSTD